VALAAGERTSTVLEIDPEPASDDAIVRLVARARRRANFVVIDGPPLGDDARALSACVVADVCLLVVRIGHTERQDLVRARELLDRTGVRPAGLVLLDAGPTQRAKPPIGNDRADGNSTAPADVVAIDR
jgi:Mrp family chromosome partitioning ATPase